MRFAFTFLSLVAAVCAAGLAWQLPRLGWLIPLYLSLQSLFTLFAWWGIIRPGVFESRAYLYFFAGGFGIVLVFALLVAISFPLDFWTGVLFIPLLSLAVMAGMLRLWLVGAEPDATGKMSLIQGAVLLVCGVLSIMALAEQMAPEMKSVALALGLFWLASGAFCWCFAVGGRAWNPANEYVPSLLAIVAFGWLAAQLNGKQREFAPQHSRDEAIQELVWESE